jgi:hypothetical protein
MSSNRLLWSIQIWSDVSIWMASPSPLAADPALYHSVLGAIAAGNHTNGGIASFIGRKSSDITHPLNVLEDCALIARAPDVFRRGRSTYRVTEPLINFYEAIMRPDWFRLESGQAAEVWRDQRANFLSRVVGPHFASVCRSFALAAGPTCSVAPSARSGPGGAGPGEQEPDRDRCCGARPD